MRSQPSSWNKILAQLGLRRASRRDLRPRDPHRTSRIERLEPRQMLSITVNTLLDDTVSGNGMTSLREALAAVTSTNSEIAFDATLTGGTIRLTAGELTVGLPAQIVGPGASHLTIDAQHLSRVFFVNPGVSATISGIKITGGQTAAGVNGGAIYSNGGFLTLDSVALTDNHAGGNGGGIILVGTGSLTLIDSIVAENSALFGGALITGTTGAINISGSAFIGNRATAGHAGAIYLGGAAGGPTNIQNSTFAGNSSSMSGGAIVVAAPQAALTAINTTIASNSAGSGVDINGGGIRNFAGSATLHNTIVAQNTSNGQGADDVTGVVVATSSYNLIGAASAIGISNNAAGNQVGIPSAPINPRLASLGSYGGVTPTMPPLPGSPAIDKGKNANTAAAFDQRGIDRVVDDQAVASAAGFHIDIGAVEIGTQAIAVADFNGDGRDDRLYYSPISKAFVVAEGAANALGWTLGDRTAAATGPLATANWVEFIAGDFNGDGRDDVLLRNGVGNGWALAESDGSAFHFRDLLVTGSWTAKYVGDFDADGSQELLVRAAYNSPWMLLKYDELSGGRLINTGIATMIDANLPTLYVGDANRDGRDDLITRTAPANPWFVSLSGVNKDGSGAFLGATNWGSWFNEGFSGTNVDADAPLDKVLDAFSWVYNNVELELYPGFMKGPDATALAKAGNAWDQAALLEKRLQALPFVGSGDVEISRGRITASIDEVRNWLGLAGTATVNAVANLVANSLDANAVSNGSTVEFTHSWVRVKLPTSTGFDWVNLDPSWKLKHRQEGVVVPSTANLAGGHHNAASVGLFDEFEYIALDPQTDHRLPVEFYEDQLMSWLSVNKPGVSLAEVAYDGPIAAVDFQRVPTGQDPGALAGPVSEVASYASFDAAVTTAGALLTHRVRVRLLNGTAEHWSINLVIPQYSLESIQVSFVSAFADVANLNAFAAPTSSQFFGRLVVGGTVLGQAAANEYFTGGSNIQRATIEVTTLGPELLTPHTTLQTGDMKYVGPSDYDRRVRFSEQPYEIVAIGLDANQHSRDSLVALQSQLLAAIATGTNEATLRDDVDDLVAYAAAKYWYDFNQDNRAINDATRSIGVQQWVGSGIVKADPILLVDPNGPTQNAGRIEYLPYSMAPRNFGVDLPNSTHSVFNAATGDFDAEAWQLVGFNSSALEHNIVEEIIGAESVSTAKGLQRAYQRDLGLKANGSVTGPQNNGSDAVLVLRSTVVQDANNNYVRSATHAWTLRDAGASADLVSAANVALTSESLESLLADHNASTNLDAQLWTFLSSLTPADGTVTVYVPTGRTQLGRWENNSYQLNNTWLGAVYYAEIPGKSMQFAIVADGQSAMNGGFSGGKPEPAPPQLKLGSFTNFTSAGDPVNVANGNMYRDETDIVFPNLGVPLTFSRHYDAQSKDDFGMGVGWMYSFGDLIYAETNGDRVWLDSGGNRHTFKFSGGVWQTPASLQGDVSFTSGLGNGVVDFTFKTRDGLEYRFQKTALAQSGKDIVGRLDSIVDRDGNGIYVQYADATRRIANVIDVHTPPTAGDQFPDRRLQFFYTSSDPKLITAVTRYDELLNPPQSSADYPWWSYSYATSAGQPNRLTSVRAMQQSNPLESVVTYEYYTSAADPVFAKNLIKRITERDGAWHEYEYFANGRVFRVKQGNAGQSLNDPAVTTQSFNYNLFRNFTEFHDDRGNVETYIHQDNGLLLKQIHADRTQQKYTWGAAGTPEEFLMTSTTDERGAVESFTYFGTGDLTFKRGLLKESIAKRFGSASGVITRYDYVQPQAAGANAKPHIVSPASIIVDVDRDEYVGKEQTTTFEYYGQSDGDWYGKLYRTLDAAGGETRLEYYTQLHPTTHIRGLVRSQTRSDRQTVFSYDAAGNVTQAVTNGLPPTQRTYDSRGNIVREVDATGVATESVFDNLGRLRETGYGDGNADVNPLDAFTTKFTYDAVGRVRQSTDPLGRVTQFEYDGQGRLVRRINADGSTREHEYDDFGNCIAISDELGRITKFVYDSRNRRIQSFYADGSVERVRYDGAGNVVAEIDALGAVTTYKYDASGRLVQTALPDPDGAGSGTSPIITNKYDSVGNLVEVIDPAFHVTQYKYDALNRVTESRTVNALDITSGVRSIIRNSLVPFASAAHSPASLETTEYNIHGEVTRTAIYDVSKLLPTILVDPLPLITTANLAQNLVQAVTTTYDPLSRPLSSTHSLGTTQIGYDAAGRVRFQTDELGRVTESQYDASLGRLVRTFQPDPDGANVDGGVDLQRPVTSYQYDAVGNRTAVTDARGFTTRFEFDAFNRAVAVVDALGNRTRSLYDQGGQVISSVDALGRAAYTRYDKRGRAILQRSADPDGAGPGVAASSTFTYDAAGRVIEQRDARGYPVAYEYDALGRVTKKLHIESLVLDNGDLGFTVHTGVAAPAVAAPQRFGADETIVQPVAGVAIASWQFAAVLPGTYRLAATWAADPGAEQHATFRAYINSPNPPNAPYLNYNLRSAPSDFTRSDDGNQQGWRLIDDDLYIASPSGSAPATVRIDVESGFPLRADAVRLERLVETLFTYDANGNLLTETDARGNVTTRTYDELDRVLTLREPDPEAGGPQAGPNYDPRGDLPRPLTTTSYDGYGNVVRVVDNRAGALNQRATNFQYDALNRRVREIVDAGTDGVDFNGMPATIDYANLITDFSYDAVGNLLSKVELPGEALERRTVYQYDNLDRVTLSIVNPDSVNSQDTVDELATRFEYDAAGNVLTQRQNQLGDSRQMTTAFEYDALGRVLQTTDSGVLGGLQTRVGRRAYDAVGNPILAVDPMNRLSRSEYDRLNRLVKATDPDPDGAGPLAPHVATFQYDAAGNLTRTSNGDLEIDRYVYDAQGRQVRSINGRGEETHRRYDATGNLVRFADPANNVTTYAYDGLNRLLTETTSSGSRSYAYDANGNRAIAVDRNGRATRTFYDRLDRPARETWFDDEDGARQNISDYTDFVLTFYDRLGRVIEQDFVHGELNGTTWVAEYRVTTSTTYDGLDRLIERSNQKIPNSGGGNSTGVAAKTTYAYAYDGGYQRVERREYVGSLTQADSQTLYYFGAFGELRYTIDQAVAGGSLTFARNDADYQYDRSGALAETYRKTDFDAAVPGAFRNYVHTHYAYDGAGRLSGLAHESLRYNGAWPAYTPLVGFDLAYDAADRISQLATGWNTAQTAFTSRASLASPETVTYSYDSAGQLNHAGSSLAGGIAAYQYIANGNRSQYVEPGDSSLVYLGPQNRTVAAGAYAYTYDAEGNLLERRLTAGNVLDQRFTWDHHNRLSQVETFSAGSLVETIAYRYNATGGLVRRSVTPAGGAAVVESYVLAEGQRAMTLNSAGAPTHRYQYGPTGEVIYDQVFNSVGQTTDLREPLGDHQHSTRVVLGHAASGAGATAVRQTVDYAPFGEVTAVHDSNGLSTTAALDVAFAHHGSLQDADTGLQLKGARWYSPDLGRFISVDPAHDGSNWYAFAGNDPVNMSDPTGLSQAGHPLANLLSTNSATAYSAASAAIRNTFSNSLSTSFTLPAAPSYSLSLPTFPQPSPEMRRALSEASRRRGVERDASARAAIQARSQSQQQSVIWSRLSGGARGLAVGVKSFVNSVASTAVSAATLGYKSYDGPLSVTQYDRDVGYDTANGFHRVGNEIFTAVATGGLSTLSRVGTATRLVGKTALLYDTAGNVLSAGRGAADAYQNGLGAGNFVQIVGGGLGIGGNVGAGGRALSELASDAGRLRVEGFGFYSGVPIPKRVYLAPSRSAVGAYDVGTADALRARSVVGDTIDIHHVGQARPFERIIVGYSRSTAPAIALPQEVHRAIPPLRGTTSLTAREVLARDIGNLRNYTDAPNRSLQQLIELNKQMYPGAFVK